MMTKALLLVPVLAACSTDVSYPPAPAAPTTPIAYTELHAGDAPVVVATGGAQIVTLPDAFAIGWSATASAGWGVEPYGDAWPNTTEPVYRVRPLVTGNGNFSITTEHGIAAGELSAADVATAEVVPARYRLDGHSPFALDASRPNVEVALRSADGARLIDGTLTITTQRGTVVAWDEIALPAGDHHTVTFTADSSPAGSAVIAITTSPIDRIEQSGGCYHAYAGGTEVATDLPMLGDRDPDATNCDLVAHPRP